LGISNSKPVRLLILSSNVSTKIILILQMTIVKKYNFFGYTCSKLCTDASFLSVAPVVAACHTSIVAALKILDYY
jgi:hypothetical protein